jgi:hypothetical protein
MRELLARAGDLYLIVPKEYHYQPPLDRDVNQHLHCWNFRALNNLLFRASFAPYSNEYRYALGWKALLPLRKSLGPEVNYRLTRLGGLLRHNGELVVRARPVQPVRLYE